MDSITLEDVSLFLHHHLHQLRGCAPLLFTSTNFAFRHFQIAGDNMEIFEKYFAHVSFFVGFCFQLDLILAPLQVNPGNADIIKALDAAAFIRKSGLNQITLKNVWMCCLWLVFPVVNLVFCIIRFGT